MERLASNYEAFARKAARPDTEVTAEASAIWAAPKATAFAAGVVGDPRSRGHKPSPAPVSAPGRERELLPASALKR